MRVLLIFLFQIKKVKTDEEIEEYIEYVEDRYELFATYMHNHEIMRTQIYGKTGQ